MSVLPEQPTDPMFSQQVGRVGEGRIARSWRLTLVAFTVVRREPKLLCIALLQMLATLVAAVVLFSAAAAYAVGHLISGGQVDKTRIAVLAVVVSYPLTFISVFFGVVMASAASHALRGKPVSINDALSVAASRLGDIVAWSLIAWLVGVVLRALIDRLPMGGRLLSWLVGLAWAIATFFAIPVLTFEGASGGAAARRSAELVRRRWGEELSGSVIIFAWTYVAAIALGFLWVLGFLTVAGSPALGGALLVAALVATVGFMALTGAVRSVFAVALYRYARDGDAIGGFAAPDLASPFVPRRGTRSSSWWPTG